MNIFFAAKALGGDVSGRNSVLCPGPRHSMRDRSLSVTFTSDEDFAVFSHAGDDWRDCKDHVRELLGLAEFQRTERPAPIVYTPPPFDPEKVVRAGTIWREARAISGTPAEAYLASRGVSYEGEALRWHPSCPFGKGERHGCMIGLVRNILTDEPQAIHRTALDAQGRKIDRMAYGPIGGGAVKLTDNGDVGKAIAIGEGIETTLSIRQLQDLGNMSIWAVLTANGISFFPVVPGIESVWIAADNDASGTGQAAARAAGDRLEAAGVETIILSTAAAGSDLNDRVKRHA